ncbi:DNA translocase FtsK [Pseudomonadota bacterium]
MGKGSNIKKLEKFAKIVTNKSGGLLITLFSFVLFISILTYSKHDPSFNVSTTSTEVQNIFGTFGAYVSDILIQTVGVVSFILCLVLFFLGINIIKNNVKTSLYLKVASFFVFLGSTSTLLSAIFPQVSFWGNDTWGGAIGYFINNSLSLYFLYPVVFTSLFLSIVSLSIILDITFSQWKEFLSRIIKSVTVVFIYLFKFIRPVLSFIFPRKSKSKMITMLKSILDLKLFSKFVGLFRKLFKKTEVQPEDLQDENISNYDDEDFDEGKGNSELYKRKQTKKLQNKSNEFVKIMDLYPEEYYLPPTNLLKYPPASSKNLISDEDLKKQSSKLYSVLQDFGIKGDILGYRAGPIITLHEFEPSAGTRAARIMGLEDDIARSMGAISARISIIPGQTAMSVELPNQKRETIYFRELLESGEYKSSQAKLPLILGKGIGGDPVIADLTKMPHLLVAGTTGSGKSVGINAMIMSLLYKMSPEECKFIMVDPKMLELSVYDGIPHLLTPVITEPGKAVVGLKWVVSEMENRYRAMSSMGVRNVSNYNEKIKESIKQGEELTRTVQTGFDMETGEPTFENIKMAMKPLPYIVVVVDEMADLMLVAGKEIESLIQRLAQMARAAGIHIIMATQRPSVDVITGVIKANFPTRISFQVTSKIDSRTILGGQGAEQLLGMGDLLYMKGGNKITRAHGPFVADNEVENIVSFIKKQGVKPDYIDDVISSDNDGGYGSGSGSNDLFGEKMGTGNKEEDLYRQAVAIVKRDKKVSISYVQRQLRIGYNKAANLIERMEREGIISEAGRNGKREVLRE